jgi:hypothetical protein
MVSCSDDVGNSESLYSIAQRMRKDEVPIWVATPILTSLSPFRKSSSLKGWWKDNFPKTLMKDPCGHCSSAQC